MPDDLKIDYLELPAGDLEEVKAFFECCFGWTFTDYGPDYIAYEDGKMEGGFYRSELCSHTKNGAALIVLYAKNLNATLDRILECGGKLEREIFDFPGGRRFHFLDPHGNEWAVWSDAGVEG